MKLNPRPNPSQVKIPFHRNGGTQGLISALQNGQSIYLDFYHNSDEVIGTLEVFDSTGTMMEFKGWNSHWMTEAEVFNSIYYSSGLWRLS